jgi:hypothetical protein
MDIAPLGFAVDTKPLQAAQTTAQATAAELNKVADAADRLGKLSPNQQFTNLANAFNVAATLASKYNNELLLTNKVQAEQVKTTEKVVQVKQKEVEVTKVAAKANIDFSGTLKQEERDLKTLLGTLDPVQAKLLKYNDLLRANERLLETGRITGARYKKNLDDLYASMQRIQQEADKPPKAPGGGFFANIMRRASTGVPGFGAVGTQAVSAGLGGAGFGAIGGLVAGGAVGLGAAMLVRELSQLPGKMADAEDSFDLLERRVTSFKIGSFADVEGIAERTGVKLEGAAKAMGEFHNSFTRFSASTDRRNVLFETALAGGRLSGMDSEGRLASAQTLAGIVDSNRVNAGQIRYRPAYGQRVRLTGGARKRPAEGGQRPHAQNGRGTARGKRQGMGQVHGFIRRRHAALVAAASNRHREAVQQRRAGHRNEHARRGQPGHVRREPHQRRGDQPAWRGHRQRRPCHLGP